MQDIINGGEGPVVLCGEDEVNKEDCNEGQDDAGEKDLNRQRLCECWSILEVRVEFESKKLLVSEEGRQ